MTDLYTADFYDVIRPGVQRSAAAVVPHLIDFHYTVGPGMTVLDVGCGEGWWGDEFALRGATTHGIDHGPHVGVGPHAPGMTFTDVDIAAELGTGRTLGSGYDLSICLEVAEHLPEHLGGRLVDALVGAAPVVLFSAAVPGQPGAGHVNLRWQDEWAKDFARRGYCTSAEIRWQLWDDTRIEWWYRQNLFLAWRPGVLPHDLEPVHAVIHPDFWAVR